MKKALLIKAIILFASWGISAQSDYSKTSGHEPGKNNSISFGFKLPVVEFFETHFGGISLNYSWSHHRFGKPGTLPQKRIGFTANGGVDYYFGKKEMVAGYYYRYSGNIYLHAFGGIIFTAEKKINIALTTGPVVGIYKSQVNPGLGINPDCSYYITDKISVNAGFVFLKHAEANALWSAGISAAYAF